MNRVDEIEVKQDYKLANVEGQQVIVNSANIVEGSLSEIMSERDALQAKLDRIKQVSDFPAKTKEMADYNRLIWKILEGEG